MTEVFHTNDMQTMHMNEQLIKLLMCILQLDNIKHRQLSLREPLS